MSSLPNTLKCYQMRKKIMNSTGTILPAWKIFLRIRILIGRDFSSPRASLAVGSNQAAQGLSGQDFKSSKDGDSTASRTLFHC